MAIARSDLADLAEVTRGRLLTPDLGDYERSRRAFNGMAAGLPLAILQPVDTADIVAALRWAGRADVSVGVRGGGHSVAGHSTPDGGLLVDLSGWRGAEVDPASQTAVALGGSRLMDLDAATYCYQLAAPSGTFVDTGIAGLTLTGGISYLVSSEGFACDALVGAELVTAAGDVVEVDHDREPELLWGLRGGGGNFGVVTKLRYRLTAVPEIAGGTIRFRGDGLDRVLRTAIELDAAAPDELALQAVVRRLPVGGPPALIFLVAWRGTLAGLEAAIAPLLGDPALDATALWPMSWLQLQAMNEPIEFGNRHYWKGHLVGSMPDAFVDSVLEAGSRVPGTSIILIEMLHGMAHRIPAASAAFGGRTAVANATAIAHWPDPADDDRQIAWAREAAARLEPFSLRGGGYLNYAEVDQSAGRVASAYDPDTFRRLRELKRAYDPANRFRFNANIPPA